jgi:Resolvase, N terminal domain
VRQRGIHYSTLFITKGMPPTGSPPLLRLPIHAALGGFDLEYGSQDQLCVRLVRNCLDWYQLLELAAAFNVLIGDEDGLYDPSDFNDRLLLGLNGTFSEIERYQITARTQRGRLNKARRGEYAKPVPIGYAYDPITGQLQLSPDQAVRAGCVIDANACFLRFTTALPLRREVTARYQRRDRRWSPVEAC